MLKNKKKYFFLLFHFSHFSQMRKASHFVVLFLMGAPKAKQRGSFR
jgi:hypothetical protein